MQHLQHTPSVNLMLIKRFICCCSSSIMWPQNKLQTLGGVHVQNTPFTLQAIFPGCAQTIIHHKRTDVHPEFDLICLTWKMYSVREP